MQEIILSFEQAPDGTYSKELSLDRNVSAIVALNMLKHTIQELNTALHKKAKLDGFEKWDKAPKEWLLKQMCEDVLEA